MGRKDRMNVLVPPVLGDILKAFEALSVDGNIRINLPCDLTINIDYTITFESEKVITLCY